MVQGKLQAGFLTTASAKPVQKEKKSTEEQKEYLPWIEKYRPKTVDDVASQEEVVNALKRSIESRNLPHLLFYGPPGTGKSSSILAIGRQLYGNELFKQRVMELNASDERGINVIRTKVKSFAHVSTSASSNAPPYKLIILDEADSMTADAQSALRRTLEDCSKTTRFCLICNYVSRIIEPLASRCAKFRFKPVGVQFMRERIKYICGQEGVPFTKELADALSLVSGGDLRKAIMLLQSAFTLYEKEITPESIIEVAGRVPQNEIEALMKTASSNDHQKLQTAVQNAVWNGFPAAQIVSQLFDVVVSDSTLDDKQKANIAEQLAITDKCLQDGADETLQLLSLLTFMMQQICSNTNNGTDFTSLLKSNTPANDSNADDPMSIS